MIDPLEPRRLFAIGDPVDTFGDHGIGVFARVYGNAIPSQVVGLRDGKTLVAVASQYDKRNRYGENSTRSIRPVDFVRLNADGSADTAFGTDGLGGLDAFFTSVIAVTERPDGKFFALGMAETGSYVARFRTTERPT